MHFSILVLLVSLHAICLIFPPRFSLVRKDQSNTLGSIELWLWEVAVKPQTHAEI